MEGWVTCLGWGGGGGMSPTCPAGGGAIQLPTWPGGGRKGGRGGHLPRSRERQFTYLWYTVLCSPQGQFCVQTPNLHQCFVDTSASMWIKKAQLPYSQPVSHQRGIWGSHKQESTQGIHPGFETEGRRHQKSKTGVSVAYVLQKFFKKSTWVVKIDFKSEKSITCRKQNRQAKGFILALKLKADISKTFEKVQTKVVSGSLFCTRGRGVPLSCPGGDLLLLFWSCLGGVLQMF